MKSIRSRMLLTTLVVSATCASHCIAQSESPAVIANEQPTQATGDDTSTKEASAESGRPTTQAQPGSITTKPQAGGSGGDFGLEEGFGGYGSGGGSGMEGGFGGGGFGGGGFGGGGFGEVFSAPQRLISSGQVMIAWSAEKDELRGFSNSLGEWAILKVPVQQQIVPVVGGDVAAVRLENAMAAYSGAKGRWDLVTLPEGSKAIPVLYEHVVQFQAGEHLYTFAAAKGMWTSPTDEELKAETFHGFYDIQGSPGIGRSFDKWLETPDNPHRRYLTATFFGGNITLRATRQSAMKAAKEEIERLNSKQESSKQTDSSPQPNPMPLPGNSTSGGTSQRPSFPNTGRSLADVEKEIAKTAPMLAALEAECQTLAAEIRQQNSPDDDTAKLKLLVTTAFELRHKLQTAESEKLEIKLATIKENLASRNSFRDRIVERRIEELLDPNGTATSWVGPTTESSFPIGKTKDGIDDALSMKQAEWPVKHGFEASPESNLANSPTGLASPPNLPLSSLAGLNKQADTPYLLSRPNSNHSTTLPTPSEAAKLLRAARSKIQSLKDHVANQESTRLELVDELKRTTEPTSQRNQGYGKLIDKIGIQVEQMRKQVEHAEAEWRTEWYNYQTYLKLLQLDVDQTAQNFESAKQYLNRFQRDENGQLTSGQAREAEQEMLSKENQLQRSEAIFELYNNIATTEPELNPDYKPAAAE